jgi:hypothetical protein
LAVEPDAEWEQLRQAEAQIVRGARAAIPDWAVRGIDRIVAAWGRCTAAQITELPGDAEAAGRLAAARVGDELVELFAAPLAAQRSTPLFVVRSAFREPTVVLADLGIPGVVRDPFDERVNPGDIYDLAPRGMADLGDSDLGPLLLAWGLTKARILQGSAERLD